MSPEAKVFPIWVSYKLGQIKKYDKDIEDRKREDFWEPFDPQGLAGYMKYIVSESQREESDMGDKANAKFYKRQNKELRSNITKASTIMEKFFFLIEDAHNHGEAK